MLEGFDSFINDVNYDEVTKAHNMQLCAYTRGRSTWQYYANENVLI